MSVFEAGKHMAEESKDLVAGQQVRAEVTAGGEVAGLIPRTVEEAYRLAVAISKSGLAPTSMATPEKCLVAIMAGAEIGLAPFQAVQGFAVINNRPVLWGDAMIAVVRSKGFRVKEWIEGEGDAQIAHCEVVRPDTGEIVVRHFTVAEAKRAKLWEKPNTPWITYPTRMLQMRARAYALRDAAADVLKGFAMREEVADVEVVEEAPQTSLRARLEASVTPRPEGFNIENPETPEELIAEIEPIGGERDPLDTLAEVQARYPKVMAALRESELAEDQAPSEAATPASGAGTEAGTPVTGNDISARASRYADMLNEAKDIARLIRLRERAADLIAELSRTDPARADALDAVFNRRHEELSQGKLL